MAKNRDEREWKELECLGVAVISFTDLLQVDEAWSVGRPEDGGIKFEGHWSRRAENTQDLGPRVA